MPYWQDFCPALFVMVISHWSWVVFSLCLQVIHLACCQLQLSSRTSILVCFFTVIWSLVLGHFHYYVNISDVLGLSRQLREDSETELYLSLFCTLRCQLVAQVTGVTISMMSRYWCCRMEKEWKNGGVSGVEESTECRRDWTCLLCQFIAIIFGLCLEVIRFACCQLQLYSENRAY